MLADADVLVVGAGPAGLSTAGALTHLGVSCLVLERDAEIGARWASRYDRLRLHTTRRLSGLAHHPLPRGLPRYVTKDDFAAYLRDYAARLELDVRIGQSVRSVRRQDGGWTVETGERVWRARVVVLATGRHDRPFDPA
jgi:cation diffusion facilitator CzcD-associated flavoprotein CzcO